MKTIQEKYADQEFLGNDAYYLNDYGAFEIDKFLAKNRGSDYPIQIKLIGEYADSKSISVSARDIEHWLESLKL
jgi:hypothetical protein